jgi:hypothetical protein
MSAADSIRESVLRFMSLATGQRRGDRTASSPPSRQPSVDELKAAALSRMLQTNADGAQVLLELIAARVSEANASAHLAVRDHPLCAGFLGAETALKTLLDDLTRLRG